MFRAIGRYFKAIGYLLTGRIDSARQALDSDPHVMRAKFDDIIRQKTNQVQEYKGAVAALIAQKENKLSKIRNLSEEIEKLIKLKIGAKAKAQQSVNELKKQNKTKEQIQQDPDYQRCLTAFNDFSSTLVEKEKRVADLEGDVKNSDEKIQDHKIQLQHLARDIEKVKQEAADSVADVMAAKQEKEIADVISGISADGTDKELQELRETRDKMKANAEISKELAGTDVKREEADFLEYARQSVANDEFEEGLFDDETESAVKPDAAPVSDDKAANLPES